MYPSLSKNDIVVEVIRRIKELDFKAPSCAFVVRASEKNDFRNIKNSACLSKYSFFCFEYYFIFTLILYNFFAFILLKVGLSLPKNCFYLLQLRPFKMIKNVFYFMLKAFSIFKIFAFLSLLFGYVEKRLDKKFNFEINDITDWTANN